MALSASASGPEASGRAARSPVGRQQDVLGVGIGERMQIADRAADRRRRRGVSAGRRRSQRAVDRRCGVRRDVDGDARAHAAGVVAAEQRQPPVHRRVADDHPVNRRREQRPLGVGAAPSGAGRLVAVVVHRARSVHHDEDVRVNRGRDAKVERAAKRTSVGARAGADQSGRSARAPRARRPRSAGADGMKAAERLAAAHTAGQGGGARQRDHHRQLPAQPNDPATHRHP